MLRNTAITLLLGLSFASLGHQTPDVHRTREFYGLEPDKLSASVLSIRPGHCVDASGDSVLDLPSGGEVDLTKVGSWGRDTAAPFGDGDDLFLYVAGNPTTKDVMVIASASNTYGGVSFPGGYTDIRKHPVALQYGSAFGGIPNFHVGSGSGRVVRYTDAAYSGPYNVVVNHSTSGAWQSIQMSPWLPDSGRIAILECRVGYGGGSAGSAYIRSIGIGGSGRLIGSGTPTSSLDVSERTIRVGSTATGLAFEIRTTGDAKVSIVVLGYEMTEPV